MAWCLYVFCLGQGVRGRDPLRYVSNLLPFFRRSMSTRILLQSSDTTCDSSNVAGFDSSLVSEMLPLHLGPRTTTDVPIGLFQSLVDFS